MSDSSPPPAPKAKFALGRLLITSGAALQIPPPEAEFALRRHVTGDWGDLCPEDREANDIAVEKFYRIFSAYQSQAGVKFWVITEADRSATTILLPEEY